ncbi:MliC family protein [Chryseobacterium sp. BLS98]|uniref:MliC family protein n=1 Tax=Chryseobacterium sp. BLS98 TaxID=885586 RepID=UPI00065AEBCD|nr:MliC family protein [Chryseobacterium sp. BLS98]
MKQQFFIASLAFTLLAMASCTKETKQSVPETETTDENKSVKDEIVESTATDSQGKIIKMSFNNTKDVVTVSFEGIPIEMKSQKPASGIWYSNDHYELRGKGSEVELSKDGKIIFEGK